MFKSLLDGQINPAQKVNTPSDIDVAVELLTKAIAAAATAAASTPPAEKTRCSQAYIYPKAIRETDKNRRKLRNHWQATTDPGCQSTHPEDKQRVVWHQKPVKWLVVCPRTLLTTPHQSATSRETGQEAIRKKLMCLQSTWKMCSSQTMFLPQWRFARRWNPMGNSLARWNQVHDEEDELKKGTGTRSHDSGYPHG